MEGVKVHLHRCNERLRFIATVIIREMRCSLDDVSRYAFDVFLHVRVVVVLAAEINQTI